MMSGEPQIMKKDQEKQVPTLCLHYIKRNKKAKCKNCPFYYNDPGESADQGRYYCIQNREFYELTWENQVCSNHPNFLIPLWKTQTCGSCGYNDVENTSNTNKTLCLKHNQKRTNESSACPDWNG